jgi:carbon-monoxide dehydrogenase medium subunit
VKPAAFTYHNPSSLDEVVRLLATYGDEAKLLAGGQSLLPVLNMRLARPQVLIDLNRVEGLAYIREEEGWLAIGAMTRHAAVERSPQVARRQPLLAEAIGYVGHTPIRNRGTIGGSLAHADPAAELPAVLLALGGEVVAVGPRGQRRIPADDLFLLYFTTSLRPDELITEVRVPVLPPGAGWCFTELARRHGDFALAGVACTLQLDGEGRVADLRLALTGVAMTPIRAKGAEALLQGRTPGAAELAQAAEAVRAEIEPESDLHATAAYRRHLAGILAERALSRALERAQKGGGA